MPGEVLDASLLSTVREEFCEVVIVGSSQPASPSSFVSAVGVSGLSCKKKGECLPGEGKSLGCTGTCLTCLLACALVQQASSIMLWMLCSPYDSFQILPLAKEFLPADRYFHRDSKPRLREDCVFVSQACPLPRELSFDSSSSQKQYSFDVFVCMGG